MPARLARWSGVLIAALGLAVAFVLAAADHRARTDPAFEGGGIGAIASVSADIPKVSDGTVTTWAAIPTVAVVAALVALMGLTWAGRHRGNRRALTWAGGLGAVMASLLPIWMLVVMVYDLNAAGPLFPLTGLPALALGLASITMLVEAASGTEGRPVDRPPPGTSVSTWSGALVVALALAAAGAVVLLLVAAGYVVWDEATPATDEWTDWDGFGTLVALWAIEPAGLALLAATVPPFVFVRRGRAGRPGLVVTGAAVSTVVSLVALAFGVAMMAWIGVSTWLLLIVPAFCVAALSVGTLVTAKNATPVVTYPPAS